MNPRKVLFTLIALFAIPSAISAAGKYDNPDTIVVARDGTGEFRTVDEAIEVCRAFMDYHKVIYIKKGTYKEKLIIPSWLQNIELCGEDAEQTVITYDDHANVKILFFDATLRLGGIDRVGLLNEITQIISSQMNVNIHKVIITCEDGIFDGSIELRVHDRDDVKTIVSNLKSVADLKEISEIL